MTKNQIEQFTHLSNRIYQQRKELREAELKVIKKFVAISDEWKVPECFWSAINYSGDAASDAVWCDYRHDGAYVVPFSVKIMRYPNQSYSDYFIVGGIECMEWSQDTVTDVYTYDRSGALSFLFWYVETFLPYLEDLKQRLANVHRVGDIGIVLDEWCNECCYEREYLEDEEVIKWYNEELNK